MAAYGGVKPIRMAAPKAPGKKGPQAKAMQGQSTLPDDLTIQAQETMGVPNTPTKELLPRLMAPGAYRVRSMG